MNTRDVRADHVEGVDWIARAIEQEVGRIEIDGDVWPADVLDCASEGHGCLLPRLQEQPAAFVSESVEQVAQARDKARVRGVARVFGDETEMRDDVSHPNRPGEPGPG